ncbi:Crp/Fnr family transcriptional regulator [Rhizobium sp. NFR03]|uniref:Crp/Fnr family transcriptional regulator n=1 Tax=Rhizobium sp. NFR03 TaxID=1566263 RepID=UPI0008C4C9C9|nr:Crp/Fnr family transcriptional regulator [Rhizobium sp. NFR03]SES47121.1 cAMP-binding domain of CRP or a regulatory subunit of cAMP-dependent protein kinases [Rhizobium sp. NFR03]
MSALAQSEVSNRLLRALSPQVFERLRPHLQTVDLPVRHVLVEVDTPSTHVWFIEHGLASTVAHNDDTQNIEVGHVGPEGMVGIHVLMKTETSPNRTFMQVGGAGISVPVEHFDHVIEHEASGRHLLLRYVHTQQLQLSHTALANGRYKMHERLARWLLMCHDRIDGDHLPLTHDFLSIMLGVRRSGVTNELHVLEGIHAIRATRGDVHILDRAKLLEIAGASYGRPEREYHRLISSQSDTLNHTA